MLNNDKNTTKRSTESHDIVRPNYALSRDLASAFNIINIEAVLKMMPDAIIIIGREGKIVLANTQVKALFGYSAEELIGQTIETLLPERVQKQHINHRKNYFSNPRIRRMGTSGMTLCLRRKDGAELPCDISLSPLKTEEDDFVVSSIRDISEIIETQIQLQRSETDRSRLPRLPDCPRSFRYANRAQAWIRATQRSVPAHRPNPARPDRAFSYRLWIPVPVDPWRYARSREPSDPFPVPDDP